ncbi:MAG TPA: hypothetical protein PKM65_13275 [Spirochaetota bacterium]|nr:hypothetical protein [Spirochaetota bacterium]HNT11037.1 hypothetical protein [Spirochaetota bacterium]HNV48651.1 hypothetical protein [Spirochaetota bacterium]HPU88570.1 hypothetical protein [Spirochaetota bacterium]
MIGSPEGAQEAHRSITLTKIIVRNAALARYRQHRRTIFAGQIPDCRCERVPIDTHRQIEYNDIGTFRFQSRDEIVRCSGWRHDPIAQSGKQICKLRIDGFSEFRNQYRVFVVHISTTVPTCRYACMGILARQKSIDGKNPPELILFLR